jgi:SpoIIAA-like
MPLTDWAASVDSRFWANRLRAAREKEDSMIELLPDMPQGVIGIRVSGRLRGDELREFKPAIKELMGTGEIRIVEVIGADYEGFGPGGLLEDLKLGFGSVWPHHSAFKRIAVVSDKEWVAHTLHALAWLVPGELAVFGLDDFERAKEWAAG